MPTLSSDSTDAQVRAAYDDNAAYAELGDAAMARAFESACRILLRRDPLAGQREGTTFQLDKQSIREELQHVRQWLAARGAATGGAARSRHLSFANFRT